MNQFVKQNQGILILISLFILIRLPYFIIDAFVPDELWFVGYMKGGLEIKNNLGYGTFFWLFGKFVHTIFNDHIFVFLRIATLASICVSAFYIYKLACDYIKDKVYIYCLITGFLMLPMFFYGGRLIAPEFYQLCLIVISLYNILRKPSSNAFFYWLLLGFAFGLKITSLPIIIFIWTTRVFIIEKFEIQKLKYFLLQNLKFLTVFITGFIICNPNIIISPLTFITNISNASSMSNTLTFSSISSSIFRRKEEWDLIDSSGFHYTNMPLVSFAILSIMILFYNRKVFINYSITSMMFAVMIGIAFWPWYSFLMPITAFVSVIISHQETSKRVYIPLFVIIMAMNSLFSIQILWRDYPSKIQFAESLKHNELYTDCTIRFLNHIKETPEIIINLSEMGGNSNHEELLNLHRIKNTVYWIKQNRDITITPFPSLKEIKKALDEDKVILLMRTKRKDLYKYSPNQLIEIRNYSPNLKSVNKALLGECGNIEFYKIYKN